MGCGQTVMHSFQEISSEEFERISVKICTSKNFLLYGNRDSLSAEQNRVCQDKTTIKRKIGLNSHDVLIFSSFSSNWDFLMLPVLLFFL